MREFHVKSYGAVGDGITVNTPILTHTQNVVFHNTAFSAD